MNLSERRQAVLADHQAQEKYDPHWKAEAAQGRKLSERPIAFLCDDEIVLLGDCAAKVLDGLKAFVEQEAALFADPQVQLQRGHDYRVWLKCQKLLAQYPAAPTEWRMSQQTWNAVTFGLAAVGHAAVVSDGTFAS